MPINESNIDSEMTPQSSSVETNGADLNLEGSQPTTSDGEAQQPQVETKTETETNEEKAIKVPERYDGETDYQYAYRMQMFNTKQQIETADSEEEKSVLRQTLREQRKGLASHSVKTETTSIDSEPEESFTEDEARTIKENLRKMGFVSADEVDSFKQQIREDVMREMRASQTQNEHADAIKTFYASRPDIAQNPAFRRMLEQEVVNSYKISADTPKEVLSRYLDMTATYLFPKQNRSAGARQAAEKRDVVDFSGRQSPTETKSKGEISGAEAEAFKAAGLPTTGWLF